MIYPASSLPKSITAWAVPAKPAEDRMKSYWCSVVAEIVALAPKANRWVVPARCFDGLVTASLSAEQMNADAACVVVIDK